jgi:hypothetical protein
MSPVAEESLAPQIDPNEAPPGYMAVLKASVATATLVNICRACDWRPECDSFAHRCMSYTIISSRNGSELKRRDGCSVVFKRKTPNA